MKHKPVWLKAAALASSIVLFSGYVYYRSGGSLPGLSSATAKEPPPAVARENEQTASAVSEEQTQRIQREVMMADSKSEMVQVTPLPPARPPQPVTSAQPPKSADAKPRKLMPSSKVLIDHGTVEFRETGKVLPAAPPAQPKAAAPVRQEATPSARQQAAPPETPAKRRTALPGSKSAGVGF
ncbi:MAG TPA: hypothetical protein VEK08_18140 [Planctomycetota bacterium]|nr:hypothetical protein [Planctomycetota bacterium]